MRKHLKWIIPLILVIAVIGVYLYPVSGVVFSKDYAKVDPEMTASLQAFRAEHPAIH